MDSSKRDDIMETQGLGEGYQLVDVVDLSDLVLVSALAEVTIVSYAIPSLYVFCLTHFGNYVRDLAVLGNVTWNLLFGSQKVPFWNGIVTMNGEEGWPRYVASPSLVFSGGNTLALNVTNNSDAVDFFVGGRFKGEVYTHG